MILNMRCLRSLVRTPVHRTQWQRIRYQRRYYSSDQTDSTSDSVSHPKWFEELRAEMLNRELPIEFDTIHDRTLTALEGTLTSFFPEQWEKSINKTKGEIPRRVLPGAFGEHIVFCNPVLPDSRLLPDGTDQLHSPGGPFVRRMWKGGSVQSDRDIFDDKEDGWVTGQKILCHERIQDVRLGRLGDSEKISVTIERKFMRHSTVVRNRKAANFPRSTTAIREIMRGSSQPCITEERIIVFMREPPAELLEDIRAGKQRVVKSLSAPKDFDFSHSLTPTNTLLSRFSALTFNSHRIHLDRDYARNVEGYNNILVHGPLMLTLMLKFIGTHLEALKDRAYQISSIEYSCLKPLFCNEELHLRAKEKEKKPHMKNEHKVYNVWIESDSGGLNFKGRVIAVPKHVPKHVTPNSSKELDRRIRKLVAPTDLTSTSSVRRPEVLSKEKGRQDHTTSSTSGDNTGEHSHGTVPVIRSIPTDPDSDFANRKQLARSAKPISIRYHQVESVGQGNEKIRKNIRKIKQRNKGPPIHSTLLGPRTPRSIRRSRLPRRIRIYPVSIIRFHNRREIIKSTFQRRGVRPTSSNKATVRLVHAGENDVRREFYGGRFYREGVRGVRTADWVERWGRQSDTPVGHVLESGEAVDARSPRQMMKARLREERERGEYLKRKREVSPDRKSTL